MMIIYLFLSTKPNKLLVGFDDHFFLFWFLFADTVNNNNIVLLSAIHIMWIVLL